MIRISKPPVAHLAVKFVVLVSLLFTPTLFLLQGAAQQKDDKPVFSEYRGVQIGMAADDVRKKLGHLKDKGDAQDFFVLSDNETAQIVYDTAHKVVTVSVDFLSGATGVPVPRDVVGSDVPGKPDGSMYKMVRYPKAGCWVSYSRTAGDSPLTSVTIQKIEN
jgi:hypothetical protein